MKTCQEAQKLNKYMFVLMCKSRVAKDQRQERRIAVLVNEKCEQSIDNIEYVK